MTHVFSNLLGLTGISSLSYGVFIEFGLGFSFMIGGFLLLLCALFGNKNKKAES